MRSIHARPPNRRLSVDIKDIPTYQQFYISITPIITNLGFINIVVVAVRLHWFTKYLSTNGTLPLILSLRISVDEMVLWAAASRLSSSRGDVESDRGLSSDRDGRSAKYRASTKTSQAESSSLHEEDTQEGVVRQDPCESAPMRHSGGQHITFARGVKDPSAESKALYVPPPSKRDEGEHPSPSLFFQRLCPRAAADARYSDQATQLSKRI